MNFTSALYLGMRHPSASLPPWQYLTLGTPAALAESSAAVSVAQEVADLQGCRRAVLLPSSLHLFWDLFGQLRKLSISVLMDAGAYPILHWSAERVAGRGISITRFPHYQPDALAARLKQVRPGTRPIVVADGFCPACGKAVPLADYLALVRRYRGLLILDDTQALGILGDQAYAQSPYGNTGGGILRHSEVQGADILVGASLAKAFGAPLAVLSGSSAWIDQFAGASDTRVHCSPPPMATIAAAAHALALNRRYGDGLRQKLALNVDYFQRGLQALGLNATPSLFPVQTLRGVKERTAVQWHRYLGNAGIRAVLSRPHQCRDARLSFLLTARHDSHQIDHCLHALERLRKPKNSGIPRLAA